MREIDRAHARNSADYIAFITTREEARKSLSPMTLHLLYLEGHLEGIVHQKASGEHVALAQQDLDHFRRLPQHTTHNNTQTNKRLRHPTDGGSILGYLSLHTLGDCLPKPPHEWLPRSRSRDTLGNKNLNEIIQPSNMNFTTDHHHTTRAGQP